MLALSEGDLLKAKWASVSNQLLVPYPDPQVRGTLRGRLSVWDDTNQLQYGYGVSANAQWRDNAFCLCAAHGDVSWLHKAW